MTAKIRLPNSSKPSHNFCNIRLEIWICLLLVLATMAVYWPVQTFPYISFDSPDYVFNNPHVKQGLTLEPAS